MSTPKRITDLQPVFLLLVHADPDQVKRLIRLLVRSGTCIVHVDAKSNLDDFFFEDERVIFLHDRTDVRWGAISQVHATLRLMRAGIRFCDPEKVSHFVLLSGSCYPIKSVVEFRDFSVANADANFIKMIRLDSTTKLRQRMEHLWFYQDLPADGRKYTLVRLVRGLLQTAGKLARRRFPHYREWFFGSQWWALNPEAVRYLVTHPHEARITQFLRFSKAPDEIYFHTLLANSPLRDTVQHVTGQGVWDAPNLHVIDPSLSRWFTASDSAEVMRSGRWFVRKVHSTGGTSLCEQLDRLNGNSA